MELSNKINNKSVQEGVIYHPPSDGIYLAYPHHGIKTQQDLVNTGLQSDSKQQSGSVTQPPMTRHDIPQQNTNDSQCDSLFKNRRQIASITGALLLMLNSGLHIGYGIWRSHLFVSRWGILSTNLLTFMLMSWSLGAFFGGFIGSILTPRYTKNVSYYISASAMLFGNLLFIIWDEDNTAIIVGRVVIGGAHGIAYVALITHAGENAAKNMRGTILSTINCMLYFGIFVSIIVAGTVPSTWYFSKTESGPVISLVHVTFSEERIISILGVLLSLGSIGCIKKMSVETIPFLLSRSDRYNAMINLKHLRNVPYETIELTKEMEEFDSMVQQDKQNSGNIFSNGNGRPLMLMIVMRLMVALTNNYLINFHAILFGSTLFIEHSSLPYRLIPLAVVAPRFIMSIRQIFYADVFKRKSQILTSATLAAFVMILTGMLMYTLHLSSYYEAIVFGALWLIFQFACSIGMDQMQDVYLSEAFSTAKKPWSISFVTSIEHIFHILMTRILYVSINSTAHWTTFIFVIMFVTGAGIIIFGLILRSTLPETRNMSLKQAKHSFVNR